MLATGSKFEALSAEGTTLDGLNIHFGCIDELHAHKTRTVYDVVEAGTGKRDNSLSRVITTAGPNRAAASAKTSPFRLEHGRSLKSPRADLSPPPSLSPSLFPDGVWSARPSLLQGLRRAFFLLIAILRANAAGP